MGNPWYPDAVKHNGAHANYQAGQIDVVTGLCHYTVGFNSIGTCGRDFQFLIDRDGTVHQGAPVDARCWGAGDPWNGRAVHIEVEFYPGVDATIFTDAARSSTGKLVRWLNADWLIPLQHYAGYYPAVRLTEYNGFIDHAAVIQTDAWHNDFWPADDWAAMIAGPPVVVPPPVKYQFFEEEDVRYKSTVFNGKIYTIHLDGGAVWYYTINADGSNQIGPSGHAPLEGHDVSEVMALDVINGRLVVQVRGGDAVVYTRSTTDGATWTPWVGAGGFIPALKPVVV